MNWGKSIVLAFVLFAGFVATMAYRMMTTKIDLVSDDYYQRGAKYDKHLENLRNSTGFNIEKTMFYDTLKEQLRISLPTVVRSGQINFFRPADRSLDFNVPLAKTTQSVFRFPTRAMAKGRWKVQATWHDGLHEYFLEQEFDL
ncbi:MAG: nitrogen fixation protein FixH [Runella slithyformis]|nr:MAG: nitrogen fixation protein FixH [Runella slithyformis]